MKSILKFFDLKTTLLTSAVILGLLIVFSFYGIYTNKLYFFKPSNYLLPIVSICHFIFLYVLWFKVKEEELTDPQMRNLEYALYGISLVYIYKAIQSIVTLFTYFDYNNHALPDTFLPIGILITVLYFLLIGLTLLTFKYRKDHIGEYKFDDMNHIDSWE